MPGDGLLGLALIALAACGFLIYVVTTRPGPGAPVSAPWQNRNWVPRRPNILRSSARLDRYPPLGSANRQLNAVMTASFTAQKLLNSSEYRIFRIIEADIMARYRGYRVFAQTNLGEILTSPDEEAFRAINSKRVDVLVVDRGGWPMVAVEYQGSGHYQGNAVVRDRVKAEALRRAGVGYVEIRPDASDEQIRSRVREQLSNAAESGSLRRAGDGLNASLQAS